MRHEVVCVIGRKRQTLQRGGELQQRAKRRNCDAADGRPDDDDDVIAEPSTRRCVIDVVLLATVVQSAATIAATSSDGSPVLAQPGARLFRFADHQRTCAASSDHNFVKLDVERVADTLLLVR